MLASRAGPACLGRLSLETHLPQGRATLVRDARLVDPQRAARRLRQLPAQHYHASPHWQLLHAALEPVVRTVMESVTTAAVAEATTRALLNLLDWRRTIVRSGDLPVSSDRSVHLATSPLQRAVEPVGHCRCWAYIWSRADAIVTGEEEPERSAGEGNTGVKTSATSR